jgi:probable addiction module antidote protein
MSMAKKKTTRFDSAVHLDSDEAISAYMEEAMETNDPAFIAYALGQVTRSRGMTEIAKEAGLSVRAYTRHSALMETLSSELYSR